VGQTAILSGSEAHHLVHVLRAVPGFRLELMDGKGKVWEGELESVEEGLVRLNGLRLLEQPLIDPPKIILAQVLPRTDRLEWILEKTTELGIDEIYLLEAQRAVVKIPANRLENKLERWRKILQSAAKQSHRTTLPLLHPPMHCEPFAGSIHADLKILFSENESENRLKTLLSGFQPASVLYGIGPEGGWTPHEERCLKDAGFVAASLGRNILRTETAAITALAILRHELGGF
jgi:16S rRNA (uracil1498-N3)-methyltransferase